MKKEAKVKAYTRKTKSGKIITVKAHSRSCKGASCASKKGSGNELSAIKDKELRQRIIKHVEDVTDGEYADSAYTWKDVMAAVRHPGEKSLRESLKKRFNVSVSNVKSKPYEYYREKPKKAKKHTTPSSKWDSQGYSIAYPHLD